MSSTRNSRWDPLLFSFFSSSVDVLQVPPWQLFGINSNALASGASICINTSWCSSLLILHWISFPVLVSFPHFMFISLSFSTVSFPLACSVFHRIASLLLVFLPTVHLLTELLILFFSSFLSIMESLLGHLWLVIIITRVQFPSPYPSDSTWHLCKLTAQPMYKAPTFLHL